MRAMQDGKWCSRRAGWMASTLVCMMGWLGTVQAQSITETSLAGSTTQHSTIVDGQVSQAGCRSCGGLLGSHSHDCNDCNKGSCGEDCIPGRYNKCCWTNDNTAIGRLMGGLYECICCPDPCYEPAWLPLADSAFFVDAARPQTQMRLRWDSAWDLKHPDRAEYFWARQRVNQIVPAVPQRASSPKGPAYISRRLDYDELTLYMEGASGRTGVSIETPYRDLDPETAAISPNPAQHASGFGDLTIGTKSLLLDCELIQVSFGFKTFIPTGDFTKGLGTSHVSLEPSILYSLKMTPRLYSQGQFSYWIPIAGDAIYQANIFHMHMSLNYLLWKVTPDVLLIGTAEFNEWTVLGGNFTGIDFLVGNQPVSVSGTAGMVSMGPGLRLFICDKIDVGVGTAFGLTGDRWAEETIRAEFRWRF